MELQRKFLLAALFVVAFLLWNNWQQEHYQARIKEAQAQAATPVQQVQDAKVSVDGFPSEVLSNVAQRTAPQGAIVDEHAVASPALIHIETDTLSIAIDRRGGNVVHSALKQYGKSNEALDTPFLLLNDSAATRYLAQSGLGGKKGPDSLHQGQALYRTDAEQYQLRSGEKDLSVVLRWQDNGISINKIFTFHRNSYAIDVEYEITNQSGQDWQGHMYAELKRKDADAESNSFHTFFGAAISSAEKPYEKITFSDMTKSKLSRDISDGWVAMVQHYFLSAWVPPTGKAYHYYTRVLPEKMYAVGIVSPNIVVANHGHERVQAKLYTGPTDIDSLAKVAPHLDLTVDYGIFWMISSSLFWVMKKSTRY